MNLDICGICLSQERRLEPLGASSLARVAASKYKNVTVETVSQIFVCWECRALFSKTAILYERVNKAHALIEEEGIGEISCENLKSMSTLGTKTSIGFDYTFVYQDCVVSLTSHAENDHGWDIPISLTQTFDYSEIESKLKEMDAIDIDLESNELDLNNFTNMLNLSNLSNEQEKEKDSIQKIDTQPNKITKRKTSSIKDIEIDKKIKEGYYIVMRDLTKPKTSKTPVKNNILENKVSLKSKILCSEKEVRKQQEYMSEMEMLMDREMKRNCHKYVRRKYRCEYCIFAFPNKQVLMEHNRKKHSVEAGDHKCDICQVRFPMYKIMSRHRSTHYLRRNHSTRSQIDSDLKFFDIS